MPFRDTIITVASHGLRHLFAPFARDPKDLSGITSILVIKPCCIGDLILATPAIGQLRKGLPHAKIVVATGAWSKVVLIDNPDVDEIIDLGQVGVGSKVRLKEYLSLASNLKNKHFQLCLVFDRSPLVSLLPLLAGVPVRAGLDSKGRGFSLNVRVPATEGKHEAELYLDIVRSLGIVVNQPQLRFCLPDSSLKWAREQLRPELGPLVVLQAGGGVNPGASMFEKRWPLERYSELAGLFIKRGYRIVAIGDQSDREAAGRLKRLHDNGTEKVIDLAGQTTLGQLGAALSMSSVYVGNDSGPTHLAAAVGTPVVAIFGPSRPESYAPYTKDTRIIYKGQHCMNCEFSGGLLRRCRNNLRCMSEISVEDVWRAAQDLLGQEPHFVITAEEEDNNT